MPYFAIVLQSVNYRKPLRYFTQGFSVTYWPTSAYEKHLGPIVPQFLRAKGFIRG